MSENKDSMPLTVTRNIDITFYSMRKNQQYLLMFLLFLLSLTLLVGIRTVGYNLTNKIVLVQAIIESLVFYYIGRSSARLYQVERYVRFLISMQTGEDTVEKFAEKGMKKVRDISNIKKIHFGGFIEIFHSKKRPNNWAVFFELQSFKPDKLVQFLQSTEKMFTGLMDKSVLKTTLTIRSDLKDYAAPIKAELNKEGMPQIVRQSMYEHQQFIENADIKTYGNYMVYYLPYTASKKEATKNLKIASKNISRALRDNKIKHRRLKWAWQIHKIFHGVITYNYHDSRDGWFEDEDLI
jgi:hypothetical protein